MSRRKIFHGALEAVVGYDRTGVLHMSVFDHAIPEDDDGHNAFDCWLTGMTWPAIVETLARFGIPLPPALEDILKADVMARDSDGVSVVARDGVPASVPAAVSAIWGIG